MDCIFFIQTMLCMLITFLMGFVLGPGFSHQIHGTTALSHYEPKSSDFRLGSGAYGSSFSTEHSYKVNIASAGVNTGKFMFPEPCKNAPFRHADHSGSRKLKEASEFPPRYFPLGSQPPLGLLVKSSPHTLTLPHVRTTVTSHTVFTDKEEYLSLIHI